MLSVRDAQSCSSVPRTPESEGLEPVLMNMKLLHRGRVAMAAGHLVQLGCSPFPAERLTTECLHGALTSLALQVQPGRESTPVLRTGTQRSARSWSYYIPSSHRQTWPSDAAGVQLRRHHRGDLERLRRCGMWPARCLTSTEVGVRLRFPLPSLPSLLSRNLRLSLSLSSISRLWSPLSLSLSLPARSQSCLSCLCDCSEDLTARSFGRRGEASLR